MARPRVCEREPPPPRNDSRSADPARVQRPVWSAKKPWYTSFMKMIDLAAAAALPDSELLQRLVALASQEREASVELVAHLAALEARPSLCAAQGFGTLFSYCTGALRLSEDAACNRIEAARACRSYPMVLDLLASGALTLTSVRLLRRHLTPENHEAVLARASGRTRRQVEALVAELAPRPDVPSTVRRLPATKSSAGPASPALAMESDAVSIDSTAAPAGLSCPAPSVERMAPPTPDVPAVPARVATARPVVQAIAPERYRVQFTIGAETHSKLERLQTLLRREIPSGDPALIFDRALTVLLEKVEKQKLAAVDRPRARRSIRPGTDNGLAGIAAVGDKRAAVTPLVPALRTPIVEPRAVASAVKRAVWRRDGGQCAYVAATGRRCTERAFVEFHHVQAHARHGEGTVANVSLRCRRHNQYEAELIFGPRPVANTASPVPPAPSSP